ncbi:MAG: response regulator [Bacteroidota bacterium]
MNKQLKKRILVVDDTTTHLMLMQSILEEEGYSVEVSHDPLTALTMIEDQAYDLILLDVMMPAMDGFQVLENLRTRFSAKQLPIIIISAKSDSWSIKQAMDKGANDYLTKPVRVADIRRKIAYLLNTN